MVRASCSMAFSYQRIAPDELKRVQEELKAHLKLEKVVISQFCGITAFSIHIIAPKKFSKFLASAIFCWSFLFSTRSDRYSKKAWSFSLSSSATASKKMIRTVASSRQVIGSVEI